MSHSHDHAQEEKKKSEDDEHNNGVMFSCGSLAPKLKRGGGCMDHGFTRPKELWEMSDGSVFLLMELSAFPEHQDFVVKNLEHVATLAYIDHFKHAHVLKEALWKNMKQILINLGKKKVRALLEVFLDPLFRAAKDT